MSEEDYVKDRINSTTSEEDYVKNRINRNT